jgi:hypothetical protein
MFGLFGVKKKKKKKNNFRTQDSDNTVHSDNTANKKRRELAAHKRTHTHI